MPEIGRFFGTIIAMYYNGHPPPHFHVRHGGQTASIEIDSLSVLDGRLAPRVLSLVTEWTAMHQSELHDDWDLARQQLPMNTIPPLE